MKSLVLTALAAATLVLAGCGTTRTDRALSGAGLGAAGGAAAGALAGDPLAGAVLGGAGGAAVGGLTDRRDIDLGKPVWR